MKDKTIVHVYFYALPINSEFFHKEEKWKKTGEETAKDSKGKEWRFEIHYGCVVSVEDAEKMNIKQEDYRPTK